MSGISSAELFGEKSAGSGYSSYAEHIPEFSDIKDSVMTGVSKVTEKLSGLGGTMSAYLSSRN